MSAKSGNRNDLFRPDGTPRLTREIRFQRRIAGLCTECGVNPRAKGDGVSVCADCRAARPNRRVSKAEKRADNAAAGLCRCGAARRAPDAATCQSCYDAAKYKSSETFRDKKGVNPSPARPVRVPVFDEERRAAEPPPPSCLHCGVLPGKAAHWTADCLRFKGVKRAVALPAKAYSE